MKYITRNQATAHDERGMAAILITMVMMTVITLVVIGFAVVSRREGRQALDRQLSMQAFYAAESGVNDARKYINSAMTSGTSFQRTACNAGAIGGNPNLSGDGNVQYTCVLIDGQPTVLTGSGISDNNAWTVPLESVAAPVYFEVSWNPSSPSSGQPGTAGHCSTEAVTATTLNTVTARTCKYPLLRVDLVDTTSLNLGSSSDEYMLNNRLSTYFLQPKPTSTTARAGTPTTIQTVPFSPSGSFDATPVVQLVGSCNGSVYEACKVRITGPLTTKMALRVTSLYGPSTVSVTSRGVTGTDQRFLNAQAVVDVTGRAADVLRRIQVRLPISPMGSAFAPNYAIQGSGSICKRYDTHDNGGNYFQKDAGIDAGLQGSNTATTPTIPGNDMCTPGN